MKVKQLIAALKKMPKDLEVYTSAHDNYEWETAGYTSTVYHHVKSDYAAEVEGCRDRDARATFEGNPEEWVTIHS